MSVDRLDTASRPTGIETVDPQPWGTHFCLFYESRDDLLDLLIPYLRAGLDNQEFCLCVTSDPLIAEEAERALEEALPDFRQRLAQGQIEIVSYLHWYLATGHFDPLRVHQGWIDKLEQGLARGYAGMRIAADIAWLEPEDWDRFAEYEGTIDEGIGNLPILAMCAYPLTRSSPKSLLDIVRHHQFTLVRQRGTWERLEGAALQRVHAEVRKLNAELEERVELRTAQLAAANARLETEIAERQQTSESLREHQELLRLLMESTFEFIRLFDAAGNTVYANSAVERLVGAVPATFTEFAHPEDAEASRRWFQGVLAGRNDYLHWRVRSRSGEWRWMETQGTVVTYRGERHVLTVCRDITDRKQAEEALRRAEEQTRNLLDTIPEMIASGPPNGTLDYCNRQWLAFAGLTLEELQGGGWQDLLHPDDRERVLQAWQESVSTGKPFEQEERHRRFDGVYRWFLARGVPLRDGEGRIERWYGTMIDIEDRKRAEAELRLIVDTIPAMVFTALPDGFVDYINQRWRQFLGLPLERVQGWSWEDTIHPEDRARSVDHWRSTIAAGEASENELRVRRADGVYRWILGRFVPLRDESGKIVRWYGVSTDIDDRKRAEEALQESAEQLRHLSRRLLEVQEEERRHLARELHDEFGQLLATITVQLHAARGVAGEAALPYLAQSMALLHRAGEQVRSLALELRPTMLETAGLEAALRWLAEQNQRQTGIHTEVLGYVNGVSGEVAVACFRIAQEALTNVVRHARAGHVWIELSQGENVLELRVRDDGVGFDVERTLKDAVARGSLGLLGMKERVERLGGSLEVSSKPGNGTVVCARFPLAGVASEPNPREE